MALTCGFFNAIKGDRKYDAMQFSELIDALVIDGIIPNQGQLFAVTTADNGMEINVGTGLAWFFHTWTKNDSVMVLTVENSDITRPRIDAVVLEVDRTDPVRANTIKIVTGEANVNAEKPTLVNTDKVRQYPLAYITVPAAAEEITAENIENMVGRDPTVFATGVLETVPLDELWNQWEGEWDTWFNAIKLQLSGDIVTNLQLQIDELKETDGILCSESVLGELTLTSGSTASDAFLYLDKQNKDLINAILNMNNFLKTGDYTTAGTHTHKAQGNVAAVFIIGGGGGGGGGSGSYSTGELPRHRCPGGGGGGGGAGGFIYFNEGINVTKNVNYNIVVGYGGQGGAGGKPDNAGAVGGSGGTSSAFSYSAGGGAGGYPGNRASSSSGGSGGNGGASSIGATGGNGGSGTSGLGGGSSATSGSTASKNWDPIGTVSVAGGGAGGGGGGVTSTSSDGPTAYSYPGSGGNGYGGSGGSRTSGSNGSNATVTYGSGGGGGGGGGGNNHKVGGEWGVLGSNGGNGGNGNSGRVLVYEKGVFG